MTELREAFCKEWGEKCPHGLEQPDDKICNLCWDKRLKFRCVTQLTAAVI